MADNTIYEPLKLYESRLKNEFADATKDYFHEILGESKIDPNENKALVKKYNIAKKASDAAHDRLNKMKIIKGVIIFFAIALLIAGGILIWIAVDTKKYALFLTLGIIGLIFAVILIVSLPLKVDKVIKKRQKAYEAKLEKTNSALNACYAEIKPFLNLLDWNIPQKIMRKVTPIIQLDDTFDSAKFDYMHEKYNFCDNMDPSVSTQLVLSGTIDENPFVLIKSLHQFWENKIYTGSMVITWTETEYDSDGHAHTVHRSQTLFANVSKPFPGYGDNIQIVYGNEACPNLNFSRVQSKLKNGDDKTVDKYVERMEKEIDKEADRAIKNGRSFTPLSNLEFEALFHAFDRNNEREFRLMFSPLAQQNICDLIKDDKYYGDDFTYRKEGCLNYIRPDHIQNKEFSADPSIFYNYDLEKVEYMFNGYMNDYFKNMYFALAPLLSIPLFQSMKPSEYFTKKAYKTNLSSYENEYLANSLGQNAFKESNFATQSILKVVSAEKVGNSDRIQVTAHSFQAFDRIDFVPTLGGDGHMHNVPVPWVEYLPVETTKTMATKRIGQPLYRFKQDLSGCNNNSQINIGEKFIYHHGVLAFLVNGMYGTGNDSEIDKVFCYNDKK